MRAARANRFASARWQTRTRLDAAPGNAARRKKAPTHPERAEEILSGELTKLVLRAVHVATKIALKALPSFAKKKPEERTDAVRHDVGLKSVERHMREKARRSIRTGLPLLESRSNKAAEMAVEHSKKEFGRLGIAVSEEPELKWLVDGWRKDLVERASSIADEHVDRVAKILKDGQGRRELDSMAADIHEATGMSERKAANVAKDQTYKLNAKINKHRQQAAGITSYVWTTQGDDNVREEHEDLDGVEFDWDSGGDPEEGEPGDAPNCFPGSTTIAATNGVKRAFRRWYSGQLTKLITDSGESLECTPNHPILTTRGWKPAHTVDVGDHVFEIRGEMSFASKGDVEHRHTTIEDVFNALALLGDLHRIDGSALQFHGDGSSDQHVDVVEADHRLLVTPDTSLAERICEVVFADPFPQPETVTGLRLGAAFHLATGSPTDRFMRRFGERAAIFRTRLRHAEEHRLTSSTGLDPAAEKEACDRLALDPVGLRKELDRGTLPIAVEAFLLREALRPIRRSVVPEGLIAGRTKRFREGVRVAAEVFAELTDKHPTTHQAVRVSEKSVREFEGHVFDLQTLSGWYATSLVNSNCRCVSSPVGKGDEEPEADDEEDDSEDEDRADARWRLDWRGETRP